MNQTGAEIVLSSTWRTSEHTMAIVNENLKKCATPLAIHEIPLSTWVVILRLTDPGVILARYGISPLVGRTADMGMRGTRTEEVLQWVDSYRHQIGPFPLSLIGAVTLRGPRFLCWESCDPLAPSRNGRTGRASRARQVGGWRWMTWTSCGVVRVEE